MPRSPFVKANPIQSAIQRWLAAFPPTADGSRQAEQSKEPSQSLVTSLLRTAPKRFTVYEPLALLPSGSFSSEEWTRILHVRDDADQARLDALWCLILDELSFKDGRGAITHLAINEGIPLRREEGQTAAAAGEENVRRSPSKLRILRGDFGPAHAGESPTREDFEGALWVETKQNGICQRWAPRWTMFSRGNVKEKARLLGMGGKDGGSTAGWAVDLYAGIGYFAFSYAALGLRVLCWEINPWSVEGLRRGAGANRWSVRVVRGQEESLGEEQIVVFLESNEGAGARIRRMQEEGFARDIRHVNCGLLPTSRPVWRAAWEMTRTSREAWLHLHDNVGVDDVLDRGRSIQALFDEWSQQEEEEEEEERVGLRIPRVEHTEKVKTYAPDVWHCVFDVHITRSA